MQLRGDTNNKLIIADCHGLGSGDLSLVAEIRKFFLKVLIDVLPKIGQIIGHSAAPLNRIS